MSGDMTPRDRVWVAIIKLEKAKFTVSDIKENVSVDTKALAYGSSTASTPSEETIKRVHRAGSELNVIEHKPGSKYYEKKIRKTVEVVEEY